MSRRGNFFNNAMIESFLGTLKAEYFHLATLDGLDDLGAGVHDYIYYYNHKRIKLGLKGLSPVEYRLEKYRLIGGITMSNFWGSIQSRGGSLLTTGDAL